MNRRKFKYRSIKETLLHELLARAEGSEGWEMISVMQERSGYFIGVLKKRVQ
jgi:hypothetical protein